MHWLEIREPFSSWSHAAWMLLAPPATFLLWRRSRGDRLKQLGMAVFGLSLTLCYAASALYHGVPWPEAQIKRFAALDFIGVYLLIAGTVTPVALVGLRGRWRGGILALVWLLAAGGIGLRLASAPLSRLVSTGIYLGMGWVILLAYFELTRVLPRRALWPAVLGGLLYSVGAVFNHLHWPALWPNVFSAHDLWHVFAMAGSLSHFWLMLRVVVPFERSSGLPGLVPPDGFTELTNSAKDYHGHESSVPVHNASGWWGAAQASPIHGFGDQRSSPGSDLRARTSS